MKKKLTYKEEQKKAKALNIIKWVCAGLGWSALLTCLILLLSLGVKGCKKQPSQSAAISEVQRNEIRHKDAVQYDNYRYLYICDYAGIEEVDSATMKLLATRVLGTNGGSATAKPNLEINQYFNGGCAFYLQGQFVDLYRARVTLKSLDDSVTSDWYYRVIDFALFDKNDNVQYAYASLTYPYLNTATQIQFYQNGSIVISDTLFEEGGLIFDALLNPFYHIENYEPRSIIFDNAINYNTFYDKDLSYDWLENSTDVPNGYTLDLRFGTFISGGQLFDCIRIFYHNVADNYFVNSFQDYNDVKAPGNPNNTLVYFLNISYVNSMTGQSVIVNVRDSTLIHFASENWVSAFTRGSTWVSQAYREVTFLYGLSEQRITELMRLNNNSGVISYGSSGNGFGGVFDLLGQAFNTWASIFNMTLIPGISLGLFIFLPLVVTIIVLVFRAVKK